MFGSGSGASLGQLVVYSSTPPRTIHHQNMNDMNHGMGSKDMDEGIRNQAVRSNAGFSDGGFAPPSLASNICFTGFEGGIEHHSDQYNMDPDNGAVVGDGDGDSVDMDDISFTSGGDREVNGIFQDAVSRFNCHNPNTQEIPPYIPGQSTIGTLPDTHLPGGPRPMFTPTGPSSASTTGSFIPPQSPAPILRQSTFFSSSPAPKAPWSSPSATPDFPSISNMNYQRSAVTAGMPSRYRVGSYNSDTSGSGGR